MNGIDFAAPTRRSVLLTGSAALAACQTAVDATPAAAPDFAAALDRWTRETVQQSPQNASRLALPVELMGGPYNTRLDDVSAEGQAHQRALAIRQAREIAAFDRTALSSADQLSRDVLKGSFDVNAGFAATSYGAYSLANGGNPYVLDQQASAFVNLPDFFDSRHTIATREDAEAYLDRLELVGPTLDAELAVARADAARGVAAPDFIASKCIRALEQTLATPVEQQVYFTGFTRKLEALVSAGTLTSGARDMFVRECSHIMRANVMPAHERTMDYLRAALPGASTEGGIRRLPDSASYYQAALAFFTTTTLTADEIHEIGLARVAELNARADQALRQEGYTNGSVGERMRAITNDPARRYPNTDEGRAQILADTRARIARVQQLAPQWFAHLPRAPIEVRRMPPVVEAVQSAAYYNAPSLDGTHPGVYYMTLRDMNTVSRVDLATVTHHEAVPGHHFQIALAQEQESIPLLRRLTNFNAYTEGWALYGEQLVDEMGFYDGDNEGRIGYLRWALWRGVRLVVDTGLHHKGWSRAQTIAYMQAQLGDDPTIIANECDRYCAWPGQACGYELGRREIVRLREEARAAMGDRFDLRGFHDVVLMTGSLPLTVLEAQVRAWTRAGA